jgi:hypothetical protein
MQSIKIKMFSYLTGCMSIYYNVFIETSFLKKSQ